MSLVVLADAQSRVGPDVSQDMIDEEEAWLASIIGPLTGERTETFFLPSRSVGIVDAIYLSRRTDTVDELTSDGDTITGFRLLDHYVIEREPLSTDVWDDPLVATFTPNDEEIVKGAIYDFLQMRLIDKGVQSERIGQYQYSLGYVAGGGGSSALKAARQSRIARILTDAYLGAYASPFRVRHTARDRRLVEVPGS